MIGYIFIFQGIQLDKDRDFAAALTLIEMADEHGRLQVDEDTARAIRSATHIPQTDSDKNIQSFDKPRHKVSDCSVSFESFNHVYGSEV